MTVLCWVSGIGERSWDFDYTVSTGKVEFAIGRITQVGYNTRRTVKISEKLRKSLEKYAGKPLKFREA